MKNTLGAWGEKEFAGLDLGDERLNKRAIKLAEQLSAKPTVSIPAATGSWADTMAAYRFFGNENTDWEKILAPHKAQTQQRMSQHPVVLCLQDTTELDFNGQDIRGLGSLSYDVQRGMYLHPTLSWRSCVCHDKNVSSRTGWHFFKRKRVDRRCSGV